MNTSGAAYGLNKKILLFLIKNNIIICQLLKIINFVPTTVA
jgi:hypothetical protein